MLVDALLDNYCQFYRSLLTNDAVNQFNDLFIERWQSKTITNDQVVFKPLTLNQKLHLCTTPKEIIKATSEFNDFVNKGCTVSNIQIIYAYLDTFAGLENASNLSKTFLILFKTSDKYQALIVSGVLSLYCHAKQLVDAALLQRFATDTESAADTNLLMQRLTDELMKICQQNTAITIPYQYDGYRIINNQYFAIVNLSDMSK